MFIFYANRCTKRLVLFSIFYLLVFLPIMAMAQTLEVPSFKQFTLEEKGQAVIIGSAPALTQVELIMGARKLGVTNADISGKFTITLHDFSQLGVVQFVLRAINADGSSITSTETANIVMVGTQPKEVIAYVQKADGTRKFISKNPQILRANFKNNIDFDVQYISYRNGALSIIGHSITGNKAGQNMSGSQIMLTIGKLRIGREKVAENGAFIFIKLIALPSSDQILRLDLLSDTGEVIGTLGVPFHLDKEQRIYSQIYKDGIAIRTILVEKGDTLSTIAEKYYGNTAYIDNIYNANREQLTNKHWLKIGQEILLPDFPALQAGGLQSPP